MFSRKQRTKQLNSFTFERIDQLFAISEIQSIVRIFNRFIFESRSSHSQIITDYMTNVQNTVSLSKNINIDMNLFDDVTNQNDFIEQMNIKLTIIKIEKKNVFI